MKYFSLCRKSDGKEVYTSPYYEIASEIVDREHVLKNLKFYFTRVNSGIEGQMNSPKTPLEVKKTLKLLDYADYNVSLMELHSSGGYFTRTIWTEDFLDFARNDP